MEAQNETSSPISMILDSETETESVRPIALCDTCGEPVEMELSVHGMGSRRIPVECRCTLSSRESENSSNMLIKTRQKLLSLRKSWGMEELPAVEQTFDAWSHSNQPSMDDLFWRMKTYAANFARYRPRTGLLLIGKNGTGKSYLLNAMARYVSENLLIPAITVEAVELLDRLRPKRTEEARLIDWHVLQNIDLLCINDIAAVHATDWAVEKMFQLLSSRAGKATCGSMNENPFEWAERGGAQIERIRSRLEEMADWVIIPKDAEDYRHILRQERARAEGRPVPK
ncbi:MAG: P-loop NTPase family protein [Armatimonadota bacterium]